MLRTPFLRTMTLFGVCLTASLSNWGVATAQPPRNQFGVSQRNRPTVSPWLSVVDNGTGGGQNALNYFNIVRPVQRGRQANRNLQNELRNVESSISRPQRGAGPISNMDSLNSTPITTGRMQPTGHLPNFGDLGGRFGVGVGGGAGGVNNFGINGRN